MMDCAVILWDKTSPPPNRSCLAFHYKTGKEAKTGPVVLFTESVCSGRCTSQVPALRPPHPPRKHSESRSMSPLTSRGRLATSDQFPAYSQPMDAIWRRPLGGTIMPHMPAENPVDCWTGDKSGIQGPHLDLVRFGGNSACECRYPAG